MLGAGGGPAHLNSCEGTQVMRCMTSRSGLVSARAILYALRLAWLSVRRTAILAPAGGVQVAGGAPGQSPVSPCGGGR